MARPDPDLTEHAELLADLAIGSAEALATSLVEMFQEIDVDISREHQGIKLFLAMQLKDGLETVLQMVRLGIIES